MDTFRPGWRKNFVTEVERVDPNAFPASALGSARSTQGKLALVFQQPLLAPDAPRVAAKVAVRPDDPVAGNHKGKHVRTVGAGNRPVPVGQPDARGHFLVTPGPAGRNALQLGPDAPLEIRSDRRQWQVKGE